MIIRSEKKGNYTILPNEFLLDEAISDKARGVLARLLARPDNWNLNINHLVQTGKGGHVAVRSAIKELEDAGYIQRDVSRHANGRIVGIEYIVRDHIVDVNEMVEAQKAVDRVDHFPGAGKMVMAREDNAEDLLVMDTHMRKTQNKGTAPITNTDIKQILKETTTTAQDPEQVVCAMALPSSSSSNLEILNLIPEKHKSPMVISFVNKAIVDYPENEVQQAVAYAAGNVRGGSFQFKAYLDKTLKNKWADGWEPESARDNHIDKEATAKWFDSMPVKDVEFLASAGNTWAIAEVKRRAMA